MKLCTISERELQEYLERENVLLVDLREPEDYMSGHLPGAVNIPFRQFHKYIGLFEEGAFEIIIFYCERGNLSLRMARNFIEKGFRAMSLAGGIIAYRGVLV